MRWNLVRGTIAPITIAVICAAAACTLGGHDENAGTSADNLLDPEAAEQCATRLAIAFTGASASSTLLASTDPQSSVSTFFTDARFVERFSRFLNSRLNPEPAFTGGDDAVYSLMKYVLTNNKPFSDLFVGGYDVDAAGTVTVNTSGLGYFRSRNWMVRYAGNELAGYRIVGAYRILQNTTGLQLTAINNVAGLDLSATGRMAPACAGCHYNGWFALDKVARVLSKRVGSGTTMTFAAPTDGPQQILGNQTIADDKQLLTALVASDHFKFNTCRHVFNFLYGRDETTAEAPVFDKCVDALNADGTIQSALAAVAKDPSFCQ